jgi:hypothetical protein
MKKLLNSFLVAILIGCTNSPSNDGVPGDDSRQFRTDCGVVFDGELLNPIDAYAGEEIFGVALVTPSTYRVTTEGGSFLVRLHNIGGVIPGRDRVAFDVTQRFFDGDLVLYRPFRKRDCRVFGSEGEAIIGNIVSRSQSLGEELLRRGAVLPDRVPHQCAEELVNTCYQALSEFSQNTR